MLYIQFTLQTQNTDVGEKYVIETNDFQNHFHLKIIRGIGVLNFFF